MVIWGGFPLHDGAASRGVKKRPFRGEKPIGIYPGQYFDAETGLHQNGYRDYDPGRGRYIEADPIGLRGGLNLFSYSLSNPITLTDPNGLSPDKCCKKDWFSCWASCIEKHRFDSVAALTALGSAYPKKMLPPFRVVNANQRLTTPLSTIAHYVDNRALASAMRGTGRVISRVATPLTIAEGLYDIGVIAYCASECEANSCSN